jgi:hypothetical protein
LIRSKSASVLSPAQKNLNRLIKQIESKRERLAQWSTVIPGFRQKFASDLLPLMEEERALKAQLAEAMDWAQGEKGLSPGERRKLSSMIVDLTRHLLDSGEPSATIKALYNKHSRSDFDDEESEKLDILRAVLEDHFGIEMGGNAEFDSEEELIARAQEQFQAKEQARINSKAKKKTAKQEARQAQREEEAKQQLKSIREIYRKLASLLHPDREKDPAERDRKTQLMQRANEAYERGALLELLELQMEIEQIDPSYLSTLANEKIQQYVEILKSQVRDLDVEIHRVESGLMYEFGFHPYQKLSPSTLLNVLRTDVASTEIQIRSLKLELDRVADPRQLKALLKTIKAPARRRRIDFDPFDDF